MPRKPRKYQTESSLVYHIINRGIICQDIFHDDKDFNKFLAIIRNYKNLFSFKIYHWCLMNNHYHLLLELPNPTKLSKIIGPIQQIYALYHHSRYHTAGRLFQGRFKSQAIEKDNYLLACGRYIERNPIRANLVQEPWKYKHSSAEYYILGTDDHLTDINPEWDHKGLNKENYIEWLLDNNSKKDEPIFHSSLPAIGNDLFMNKLIYQKGRLYPRRIGRPKG